MVKENRELMAMAREALTGNWGLAVGTFLVYMLMICAIQIIPVAGSLASLLISGPLAVGWTIFSLTIARRQEASFNQIFEGFKNFGNALGTYLLLLIIVFLWSLLLIVPGIIAAISYSQVFYILAEDNTISPMDALKKSKAMMDGYKWKYFCLGLRFLGWVLLCILTLGIGFLWLVPYIQVSYAYFYEDLKTNENLLD